MRRRRKAARLGRKIVRSGGGAGAAAGGRGLDAGRRGCTASNALQGPFAFALALPPDAHDQHLARARGGDVEQPLLLRFLEALLSLGHLVPSRAARDLDDAETLGLADDPPVAPRRAAGCGRSTKRGGSGRSARGSARKTTGASRPLAPWTVISRTASRPPGLGAHLLDVARVRHPRRARATTAGKSSPSAEKVRAAASALSRFPARLSPSSRAAPAATQPSAPQIARWRPRAEALAASASPSAHESPARAMRGSAPAAGRRGTRTGRRRAKCGRALRRRCRRAAPAGRRRRAPDRRGRRALRARTAAPAAPRNPRRRRRRRARRASRALRAPGRSRPCASACGRG